MKDGTVIPIRDVHIRERWNSQAHQRCTSMREVEQSGSSGMYIIIIIIDNFCIALFSGVPKLTALYNILQHFLSFTNIIYIIMTTNNV